VVFVLVRFFRFAARVPIEGMGGASHWAALPRRRRQGQARCPAYGLLDNRGRRTSALAGPIAQQRGHRTAHSDGDPVRGAPLAAAGLLSLRRQPAARWRAAGPRKLIPSTPCQDRQDCQDRDLCLVSRGFLPLPDFLTLLTTAPLVGHISRDRGGRSRPARSFDGGSARRSPGC
jgi:hypothetical protein